MMLRVRNAPGLLLALFLAVPAGAAERLPEGFVYLREVAPGIVQDMRYAGFDNFTGRPLPGYAAPECVLRRAVAQALARVQADLARENLGLKVYDCYRPARAVAAFVRWAQSADDGASKRFYPALEKRSLFAQGYIAAHSGHSTGMAVDLTLVKLAAPPTPAFDRNAALRPLHRTGRSSVRPTIRSTWAPASTASIRRARLWPARPRPSKITTASFSSQPCASAACTIISANGGTSVSARARRRFMILRLRRIAPSAWNPALVRQQPLPVLGRDFDHPHQQLRDPVVIA